MISPATMRSRVTEKMIKRRPVIALVKSSLPFLTASALSPPVMIWIVAISINTREIAPAVPAKNVKSSTVNPFVSTLKQPRAVSMAVAPQLPLGSIARTGFFVDRTTAIAKAKEGKCVRMEICLFPGNFFVIL